MVAIDAVDTIDATNAEHVLAIFTELYEQFYAPILTYCAHWTGNEMDAEDVTQLVFEKALIALPDVEGRGNFWPRPWLYRIATNCLVDRTRHRAVRRIYPEAAVGSSWTIDDGEKNAYRENRRFWPWQETAGAGWESLEETQPGLLDAREALAVLVRPEMPHRWRQALYESLSGLSYEESAQRHHTTLQGIKSILHRARKRARALRETLYASG